MPQKTLALMEESAASVTGAYPSHPWGPFVVNRPATADGPLLKVVAFNAFTGGALEQICEALRRPPLSSPDIILLSEMDWRMRRSGRRETAAQLADELKMSFAYIGEFGVPRADQKPVSFMGNAILANRPLAEVRVLPIERTKTRHRIRHLLGGPAGLAAEVTVNRQRIALGVVHLNSRWTPGGRELQMRQYLRGFPGGMPAIIGGDLNTTTLELSSLAAFAKVIALLLMQPRRFSHPQKWEPLFERLHEAGFETSTANVIGKPTFALSWLMPTIVRPKLDWLAVRGLQPLPDSAAVIPAQLARFRQRFSDHDFVVCSFEV